MHFLITVGTQVILLGLVASEDQCACSNENHDLHYVTQKVHFLTTDSLQYGQKLLSENKERIASETKIRQELAELKKENKEMKAQIAEYRADDVKGDKVVRKALQDIKGEQLQCRQEMSTLKNQLQSERLKITELKLAVIKNANGVSELKKEVASQQRVVAFSAYMNDIMRSSKSPPQTIIFGGIRSNVGGAYSASSGIFTAPIKGTYFFFAKILSYHSGEYTLIVNGHQRMELITDQAKGWKNTANAVVVQMKKGEQAFVRYRFRRNHQDLHIHHYWSTFSGYLIHADI